MKIALAAVGSFVATLTSAPHAFADGSPSVIVASLGPGTFRLRVAAGSVFPCSSSSNTQLFDGSIAAGQQVGLQTDAACVCVEHTSSSFPDKDWSTPQMSCRPTICTGAGRSRVCRPDPDQTIRVVVFSIGN